MPLPTRELQREYQRGWCAERRREWLDEKVCVGCGSEGPLEVHHLDPAEKVHHAIWSWAEPRRLAELAKCVTLCPPCHYAVHRRLRRAAAIARNPHGTQRRYQLGCRCAPCGAAHKAYNLAHPAKAQATA